MVVILNRNNLYHLPRVVAQCLITFVYPIVFVCLTGSVPQKVVMGRVTSLAGSQLTTNCQAAHSMRVI